MIASDPVETKRISLGSVFEHSCSSINWIFHGGTTRFFCHDTGTAFSRVQVSKAVRGSVTCEGSISPVVLGNSISNVGVCPFWLLLRRPGRRKRRPKEMDSLQNRGQMLPCQLPLKYFFSYFCLFFVKKVVPCLTFISSFHGEEGSFLLALLVIICIFVDSSQILQSCHSFFFPFACFPTKCH